MKKIDIIGIGCGGHAKVLLDILNSYNEYNLIGLISPSSENIKNQCNIPIIGDDSDLPKLFKDGIQNVFIAFSSLKSSTKNKNMYNYLKKIGFNIINVIHKTSIISNNLETKNGIKIMAGVIINPSVKIGNNSIINTGAIIDHDCLIEDHVQIAPGTILGGNVLVGEGSFIGLGARIIENITIGKYSYVAAGSIVTSDVKDGCMVAGVPAIFKKKWPKF